MCYIKAAPPDDCSSSPATTIHHLVSTHSSREPGCQCHLEITLQANQGRNQDKNFCNCPKHLPVLEREKGIETTSVIQTTSVLFQRGVGSHLTACPIGVCSAHLGRCCILEVKEAIFSVLSDLMHSPHVSWQGRKLLRGGSSRFWKAPRLKSAFITLARNNMKNNEGSQAKQNTACPPSFVLTWDSLVMPVAIQIHENKHRPGNDLTARSHVCLSLPNLSLSI